MQRGKKAELATPKPSDELAMMTQAFVEDAEEIASFFEHERSDEETGADIDSGPPDTCGI